MNAPTTYFGGHYDMHAPLPWHNTLAWTLMTVPIGTLALFVMGCTYALRTWRCQPQSLLLVGNWATLVVVRATPWAPPHDAERLFLPSFGFLALLAGIGADALWSASRCRGRVRSCFAAIAICGAFLTSAASTIWYSPQWLSYYNVLVGGLRGATALGMEPTYYWDGLDSDVLDWLHENTEQNEKIAFGSPSWENLELMRRWGTLRCPCLRNEEGQYRWYIVQRRPSAWSAIDRRLVERMSPVFRKMIRRPGTGWGAWQLDVPIVEVFDFADYRRVSGSFP